MTSDHSLSLVSKRLRDEFELRLAIMAPIVTAHVIDFDMAALRAFARHIEADTKVGIAAFDRSAGFRMLIVQYTVKVCWPEISDKLATERDCPWLGKPHMDNLNVRHRFVSVGYMGEVKDDKRLALPCYKTDRENGWAEIDYALQKHTWKGFWQAALTKDRAMVARRVEVLRVLREGAAASDQLQLLVAEVQHWGQEVRDDQVYFDTQLNNWASSGRE